ncbi:protein phosphatase 1D-like [Penaeus vannamei]|uniref:protein phosphatase 1D-like n=1 Tax=Penaeus vannamei TaxID=6689 RepID=UPI00387F7152
MSSRVGVNLRASAYLHQGDRKYMEDEFQVAYQRTHDKKDIEYAFFGIFDGHGGKEAAHFAKDNLMDNIVSLRAFWSDDDEDVLAAIKEGFLQTHMAMWKVLDQWPRTASGWPSTSGTTASVAFIRRQKIYIGHVGDSGIVLGCEDPDGGWHGEALTRDHKPESIVEKTRITECGGKVINKSGVPRVVWNRPKSGHQGPVRRSTPMDNG